MAGFSGLDLDYLNVGAVVSVRTMLDKDIEGEVIACDGNSRMLLLRSHRPEQDVELDDLHIINMDHVKNVKVLREVPDNFVPSDASDLPHVDLAEISNRLNEKLALRAKEKASSSSQNKAS
ncbi:LSM12 homolog A-like [Paramacrobiotus metropolitanus]|uniref:LSM12 homolog A-like n=1 Tax=Paramacrobiotus metropolitanus TaxID=2943436 RepID=UPI0024459CC6|nr:LSM12 homolog A-like [Paramacrobiotus metropolitanus]